MQGFRETLLYVMYKEILYYYNHNSEAGISVVAQAVRLQEFDSQYRQGGKNFLSPDRASLRSFPILRSDYN